MVIFTPIYCNNGGNAFFEDKIGKENAPIPPDKASPLSPERNFGIYRCCPLEEERLE
jgi:hypothetical protein